MGPVTDESGKSLDLTLGLTRIAGLLLSEETLQSILDLVVALTKKTIGGVDGCGVTMYRDGKLVTTAHSDELVKQIDAKQYERESGPCISAILERRKFRVDDLSKEMRWPEFARDASAEGIMSVLSIPFIPVDEPIGCLNIYSRGVHAFDKFHEDVATLFANQAAIVLANSQAYSEREQVNEQLREALQSRELIGQAKGILMHRDSIGADEAFDALKTLSQNSNRKLRDLAEEIVNSLDGHKT